MKPSDIIECIYTKNGSISTITDQWVAPYLNKALLQNPNNASIIERVSEYTFYIAPTYYFYLLYFAIPKNDSFKTRYFRKDEDNPEDVLVERLKYVLGWSTKEYNLNKSIIEKTILKDRPYWLSEMGLTDGTESKRKK
jgi:hypothetical protein